jgi:hypothetical protein
MPSREIVTFDPSSLETIDQAVYKFVNETINPHTMTNEGFSKVPILWLGTERPYQIKHNKNLRDSVGRLILPLITVTRTGVTRDDFKGSYQSYYPVEKGYQGGVTEITKIIKQDKTRNFAVARKFRQTKGDQTGRILSGSSVAKNRQVVYETITVPKPTYVTCMFEVNIRTEYQQQMNDLVPPFIVDQRNVFPIDYNGHKYELFIQDDYGLNNNFSNFNFDERMLTAKISFKVLGYLVGDGNNRNRPKITRRQNAVTITISKERSMLDERIGGDYPWAGVPFDDENENLNKVEAFTGISEDPDTGGSVQTTGSFRQF